MAGPSPLALLRPHWRLVLAAFLGWFLDAFDQVALLLVLPQVGQSFGVSLTAMGLVITAQSLGRVLGNTGWGWLADRYGRKLTFMAGVIWFALFSGMTALAWSYAALVAIQLLFGIGFGGEWTASAALLMETVPAKARSVASSLMMAGYEVGFFAAAGMQALLVPVFGWRSLFVIGIAPALLAVFIRVGIGESPVWLETQRQRREGDAPRRQRHFTMDRAAWQACGLMFAVQFQTAAAYSFYPTLLTTVHHYGADGVFAAVTAYSAGSIGGKLLCGWIATRIGDRVTMLGCLLITVCGVIPFVGATNPALLLSAAVVVGASSSGVFALVPHYLSVRFGNAVRSFGMGLAYAVAACGQGVATYAVPAAGTGIGLVHAVELFVIASSAVTAAIAFRDPATLPGRDMDMAA